MLADPAAGRAELHQLGQRLRMIRQQCQVHRAAGYAFQQIEYPLQGRVGCAMAETAVRTAGLTHPNAPDHVDSSSDS
jgi:hypothetical protein